MSYSLEDWAYVYTAAAAVSRRPLADVAVKMGVSQSTATRRIADARKAHLLPQHSGAGLTGTNPKLAAIAKELSISVEDLRAAILKHAPNGDLRVR